MRHHPKEVLGQPLASTQLHVPTADHPHSHETGSAQGWVGILKANPECRFGGEDFHASEVTDSAEHARLYALAQKVYAGYGDYMAKTASYGRRIPLFRLRAGL